MKKIDEVYVQDILTAIKQIEKFVSNMTFKDFEEDDRTQFAIFHAFEIVGEAANKLSKDFQVKNKDFPIKETVELRNFLIHGYDLIRLDTVWETIKQNLPPLKEQVESILKAE